MNKITEFRGNFKNLNKQNFQLSRYTKWVSGPLNNAQFGAIALYRELVPAFKRIFELCSSDFERFYKRAEEIAKFPEIQRQATLNTTNECH